MLILLIQRFNSLDLGVLATSFSLLRLPKMPELRDKHEKINFKAAGPEIDIYGIKYKDKVREAARQKRLAAELAAGGKNANKSKPNSAWPRNSRKKRIVERTPFRKDAILTRSVENRLKCMTSGMNLQRRSVFIRG